MFLKEYFDELIRLVVDTLSTAEAGRSGGIEVCPWGTVESRGHHRHESGEHNEDATRSAIDSTLPEGISRIPEETLKQTHQESG